MNRYPSHGIAHVATEREVCKNEVDDHDLVARLRQKDEAALWEIQNSYGGYIRSALNTYLGVLTREDLEEVYCDALGKIWQGINKYDEQKGKFSTWLFRVAKNCARDRCKSLYERNKKIEKTHSEDFWQRVAEDQPTTEDAIPATNSQIATVKKVLADFTEEERYGLIAWANLPGEDTTKMLAAATGKTVGAIRVARHRAFKKLRSTLKAIEL